MACLESKHLTVFRYLLDTYGWRGTLLIMGGMMLHAVPFSYLMHEPTNSHIAPPISIKDEINEDHEVVEQKNTSMIAHNGNIGQKSEPLLMPGRGNGYIKSVEMQMSNNHMESSHIQSLDFHSLPTGQEYQNGYPYSCSLPKRNSMLEGSLPKVVESSSAPKAIGFLSSPIHRRLAVEDKYKNSSIHSFETEKIDFPDEICIDDGDEDKNYNEENNKVIINSTDTIPLPYDTNTVDVQDMGMKPSRINSLCSELASAASHIAKGFLELKDPTCLLMFLGALFVSIGYQVPYLFLPMKALLAGNTPWSAAALISMMGISDAIGRIFFGWLGNFRYPGKMVMLTFSTFTCGLCCLMFGLVTSYKLLGFFCVLYGASVGR